MTTGAAVAVEPLEDRTLLATQLATLVADAEQVSFGSAVNVDINYDLAGTVTTLPNGIALQIHYDSTRLTFDTATNNPSVPGFQGRLDREETVSDGDPATDRMVEVLWFVESGGWPVGTALPARLATLSFTSTDQQGITNLNVTRTVDPLHGFTPAGTRITVTPRVFVVDTLVDEDNNNADTSLREAIGLANAGADPGVIRFDESIVGIGSLIELSGTQLPITHTLVIEGPGVNQLIIDGGDTSRIFDVSAGATVTLNGLTFWKSVPLPATR